jgi:peptide deformylase
MLEEPMTLPRSDRDWIAGIAGEGIVTVGDPRLKQPAALAEDTPDVLELLAAMVGRLRGLNGAGLAAPQVGAAVRVVVIEVRRTDVFPDRPETPLLQMVNPVIIERSGSELTDWEGCFSVPGLMGQVPRAERVRVEYTAPDGGQVMEEYEGYAARVIQHEVDHLDGVEFLDRMLSMKTITTVQNYLAFHRHDAS